MTIFPSCTILSGWRGRESVEDGGEMEDDSLMGMWCCCGQLDPLAVGSSCCAWRSWFT